MSDNSLTPLIPSFIRNFLSVLREQTAFTAVTTGFGENSVPVGKEIIIPHSAPVVGEDFTPSMQASDAAGLTVDDASITITKQRAYPFKLTGEDWLKAGQLGADFQTLEIQQAARTFANEVWADICGLQSRASQAIGTAGATPFAADTSAAVAARKALNKSLAPKTDRYLIVDGDAEENLLNLGQFKNYYQAGGDQAFRQGIVGPIVGFQSSQVDGIQSQPAGTGAGYVLDGAHAAGAISIKVKTGTGTILAGGVVTIAGDATQYVVDAGVAAPGTFTINPLTQDGKGLKKALADGAAVTLVGAHVANLAFHRSAIGLAVRPIAMPPGGDAAVDYQLITDPTSGLTVGLAHYKGRGMSRIELQAAWGVSAIRRELLKKVLG